MKKILTKALAILLTLFLLTSIISCDVTHDTEVKDIDGDYTDDIKDIVYDTDQDTTPETSLNTPSDTQVSTESETQLETPAVKDATISESICFEYNGLVVTAKEIITDSYFGTGIKILIENNSDKDYTVGLNEAIVNNCMISSSLYCTVAAGKKANDKIYLSSSELDAAGIDNIGQIELYFDLTDPKSYETVYKTECITIKTSLYEEMDTTPNDVGQILYEKNGIKIIGKYVDESTFWGASVLLYVENTSDQNITVSIDDLSVNGFMVDGFFHQTVYKGKYAINDISIFDSDLEENDITSIEEIELKFHIYNSETYKTIADTDAISFATE